MRRPPHALLAIAGGSLALRIGWVYGLSSYGTYLVVDMAGYWQRALEFADGDTHSYNQWRLSPPFPHIALGVWVRALRGLGVADDALLPWVLATNILLSVVSIFLVYGIARRHVAGARPPLVAAALYAFFPALVYFDAFVLSEHPTTFGVLLATYLVVACAERRGALAIAGAALGFATLCRTAVGLVAAPLFLFLTLTGARRLDAERLRGAAGFAAGYLAVVGLGLLHVHQVSGGQLSGLSAVGGINFFFMSCKPRQVISTWTQPAYYISPPSRDRDFRQEVFTTDEPWHNQSFFFRSGARCIADDPGVLLANLAELRHLFYTNFHPWQVPEPRPLWRLGLHRSSQTAVLAMLASLALLPYVHRHARADGRLTRLFAGIVGVEMLTMYFFLFEHRYAYPFLFAILLPFVAAAAAVFSQPRRLARAASLYALATAGLAAALWLDASS